MYLNGHNQNHRRRRREGQGGSCRAVAPPALQIREKKYFGQTLCNIRAVDIFLEEEQAPFIFDSILFFISCRLYVEYSFEFRNPF